MLNITALLSGLLFGLGLIISGMANPAKVTRFLDLAGHWDPSLALVMIGAISIGLVSFSVMTKRTLSILKQSIQLPKAKKIDAPLIIGSALFGIGWGLAGICPGPALVLLTSGFSEVMVFVAAMLAGMWLFRIIR